MARRIAWFPEVFYQALCTACHGLQHEVHRFELALMVWEAWSGRRSQHRLLGEGYASFYFLDLGMRFGRYGFKRINDRYRIFEVTDKWSPKKGENTTRGYKLTTPVAEGIERYLRDWLSDPKSETSMINGSGRRLRTFPAALASRTNTGAKARVWRGVPINRCIAVDSRELRRYYDLLEPIAAGTKLSPQYTAAKAERLRRDILKRLLLARTDVAGSGNIIQCYVECSTARMFSGNGLQSAPRQVKSAALPGHWDYDFRGCHTNLMEQIARNLGVACGEFLRRYNRETKKMRREIAEQCDLQREDVKRAVIAVLYGAPVGSSPRGALAWNLAPDRSAAGIRKGVQRAARLVHVPMFRALAGEISGMGRAIVDRWPNIRCGKVINDAGCAIDVNASWARKLAHILQGAEAVMLRVVAQALGESVEVLQHDGWTSAERLDKKRLRELRQQVRQETGYRIFIEVKRLQSPVQGSTCSNSIATPEDAHGGQDYLAASPCQISRLAPTPVSYSRPPLPCPSPCSLRRRRSPRRRRLLPLMFEVPDRQQT